MKKHALFWILGASALVAVCFAGLCLGSGGISIAIKALAGSDVTSSAIFFEIRLPRVLMAGSAGCVLASSGLIFQTVLRNPLSEPYILGISGGAAIGVICARLFNLPPLFEGIAAFAGGLSTLGTVLAVGIRRGSAGLLLSGVMVNSLCGAVILFAVSLLQMRDLTSVMFWFLGDLGSADLAASLIWTTLLISGCCLISRFWHALDLLLLGEDAAQSLGLSSRKAAAGFLACSSLLTSACVCAAGPIGFVGLLVPHFLRLAFGSGHRFLFPACMLCGAVFLIACDAFVRLLPFEGEMPIGVATALIGAPAFIFLLMKSTGQN